MFKHSIYLFSGTKRTLYNKVKLGKVYLLCLYKIPLLNREAASQYIINYKQGRRNRISILPLPCFSFSSSVKCVDYQQNEINPHKRNDYPQLNGFTNRGKLRNKCNQVRCLSVLYKQLIPLLIEVCKLFSYSSKLIHALLSS